MNRKQEDTNITCRFGRSPSLIPGIDDDGEGGCRYHNNPHNKDPDEKAHTGGWRGKIRADAPNIYKCVDYHSKPRHRVKTHQVAYSEGY